jgi:hypothetical protein
MTPKASVIATYRLFKALASFLTRRDPLEAIARGPSNQWRRFPRDSPPKARGAPAVLGPIQLPVDRPEDEPRRLGALATELLALLLFEGAHQVAQEQVQ